MRKRKLHDPLIPWYGYLIVAIILIVVVFYLTAEKEERFGCASVPYFSSLEQEEQCYCLEQIVRENCEKEGLVYFGHNYKSFGGDFDYTCGVPDPFLFPGKDYKFTEEEINKCIK